jgi:hypothetical protein
MSLCMNVCVCRSISKKIRHLDISWCSSRAVHVLPLCVYVCESCCAPLKASHVFQTTQQLHLLCFRTRMTFERRASLSLSLSLSIPSPLSGTLKRIKIDLKRNLLTAHRSSSHTRSLHGVLSRVSVCGFCVSVSVCI